MKNLLIVIIGLAIIAANAPTVHADEHREHREHHEHEHHDEEHEEELEMLDRNVRLEFQLLPPDEDDHEAFIVTASPWYATHTEFRGEGMELEFHANGIVQIIDDNEFFVTYEVGVLYQGEEGDAKFHVDSSVRLVEGQAFEVATMGDKTLVIRATYADGE